MRLQIMQNLEITIDKLHMSYETYSTTKLGHPFSFGLTIYHLEMMVRIINCIDKDLYRFTVYFSIDNDK